MAGKRFKTRKARLKAIDVSGLKRYARSSIAREIKGLRKSVRRPTLDAGSRQRHIVRIAALRRQGSNISKPATSRGSRKGARSIQTTAEYRKKLTGIARARAKFVKSRIERGSVAGSHAGGSETVKSYTAMRGGQKVEVRQHTRSG
jgi:hypothetical protein